MDKQQIEAFYPLSTAVRSLFHKMGHAVTTLHEGTDMTAGLRAILESVIRVGPKTVPELARMRPVSRQHVQITVNALLDMGYVTYQENPSHRRSKLVQVTQEGKAAFKEMKAREAEALSSLALDLSAEEMDRTKQVLSVLIERFESPEWQNIIQGLASPEKT